MTKLLPKTGIITVMKTCNISALRQSIFKTLLNIIGVLLLIIIFLVRSIN